MTEKEQILESIKTAEKSPPTEAYFYYQKTQDKDVQDALMQANDKLVFSALKELLRSGGSFQEDNVQIGREGLLLALKRYDPSLGNTFSTFAYPYIRGYVSKNYKTDVLMGGNIDAKKAYAAFRNYQKENPTFSDKQIMEELDFSKEQEHMVNTLLYMNSPLSLQMDIGNDPGQEALLEEIIPDGRDDYLELENKLSNSDVLNSLKKNLTEEEFEFLSDLYLKNYKDTAYAKEKNVSKQAVNTRKIRILRKLKSPSVNHRLRQDLGVPDDMPNDKIISYLYER